VIGPNDLSFWPNQTYPSPYVPGLAAPAGRGSVKALTVYDHGACSHEVQFADLFGNELDDIWTQVKQEVQSNAFIDSGTRQFEGVTSYVSHSVGTPNDVRGGVIIGGQFLIKTPWPLSDTQVNFSVEYPLQLTDGIIDGAPPVLFFDPPSGKAHDAFVPKLQNGPTLIHQKAVARQVAPVAASSLSTAKTQLIFGAALAADALYLADSDLASIDAQINDNANWTNFDANGQCLPTADGTTACQYIVRAKRLNFYPNAVETVFFEYKDPANPTYALYAAAVGADLASKSTTHVAKLCTTSFQAGGSAEFGWSWRDYFVDTRGYEKFDP
jgi:hypothetical protein